MNTSEQSEIKKSGEAEKHQETKENAEEQKAVQPTIHSRKLKDVMTNSIESSDSGDENVMQPIDEEKMK